MIKQISILLLSLLSYVIPMVAQSKLENSARHSQEVHIYQLTHEDLQKVFLKKGDFDQSMLTKLVAKYKLGQEVPQLNRGNYLKVRTVENKLVFEQYTIDNLMAELLPDKDLVICLYDTLGNVITDATVKVQYTKLKLSPQNKTYSIAKAKKQQVIEIDNKGVYHYRDLNLWTNNYSYRRNNDSKQKDNYIGFVVFSKPKYKPNETVKLKAYLANKSGKGYDKPINLRLKGIYNNVDTILSNLSPYRPGMYTYEFPIPSKFALDKDYKISLEIPNNKSNTISANFRYEDYELKSTKLSFTSEKQTFYTGDSIQLKAKVTNENEMPVYGGKLEIKVEPYNNAYLNTYDMSAGQFLYIPNLLWSQTYDMKDLSEKTIVIPDSIFPKNMSFLFSVSCTYSSADNEVMSQSLGLSKSTQKYRLAFAVKNGMLQVSEMLYDQATKGTAKISFVGTDIIGKAIQLPDTIAIPWTAKKIEVETRNVKDTYSLSNLRGANQIDYSFYRKNDSIRATVNNPANIPFWYTIEKKNRVIAQGYATNLDYAIRDKKREGYRMRLTYIFGGQTYQKEKNLAFVQKNINMQVDMPSVVYPGQKVDAKISILDTKNRPVKDVDITAYGFTSKFGYHPIPDLPFGGVQKEAKPFETSAYKISVNNKNKQEPFGKEKWFNAFVLDTIEYYKFLYPDYFYSFTTKNVDESTQVSPYVVIDGALQNVEMLWIDDILYYANQSQQLQTYTFDIKPGIHDFTFRIYDRIISVNNIVLEKGLKYILSFNAAKEFNLREIYPDSSSKESLNFVLADKDSKGKLTSEEMTELRDQLIAINNNFGYTQIGNNSYNTVENPGILKTANITYYINPISNIGSRNHYWRRSLDLILVGPFPQRSTMNGVPNMASVSVGDSLLGNIGIEGGFVYTLYPDYQKMEEWKYSNIRENFDNGTPMLTFNDTMTQQAILDSVQNQLVRLMQTSWGQINLKQAAKQRDTKGDYIFRLKLSNVKNKIEPTLIYFEPVKEDTISTALYYGGNRNFSLFASDMTMYLIFSDSTSYQQTIHLQKDGTNYLRIDSISSKNTNPQIVKRAYELFNNNVERTQYHNPYLGNLSDTITYAQQYHWSPTDYFKSNSSVGDPSSISDMVGSMEYNVQDMQNFAKSPAPGVRSKTLKVEGVTSLSKDAPPALVIVDGKPYSGNIEDIAQESIVSINTIADGSELFGEQGANGVIIITTKNGADTSIDENMTNSLRRNFHDDAFWQPQLKTGIDGKASFQIEYPDDITYWNTYFIAVGGKNQYDTHEKSVKSYKALMAQLFTPRFAVRGDSIVNVGKITNYLGDTLQATQIIDINGQKEQKNISLSKSYTSYIPLIASQKDSVKLAYAFQTQNGFFDGEERSYPILEKGMFETKGDFKVLNESSTQTLTTDPTQGTITFHAEASSLDLFLTDIQKIDLYPYMCNEQMASKLNALLLKEYIYKLKGEKFKEQNKIKDLIKNIEKNKNQEKMWGWWNNDQSIFWISKYVATTLLDAEQAGYNVNIDKASIAVSMISSLDRSLRTLATLPKDKKKAYSKAKMLQELELVKRLGAMIDFAYYFNQINIILPDNSDEDMVNSMYTMSAIGLADKVDLKKMLATSHKTIRGSIYWGNASSDKNIWRNIVPSETNTAITVLAYKTIRNIGNQDSILDSIRNYFLEQRHNGSWNNTYESASILTTIMPDMVAKGEKYEPSVLTLNGKKIDKFPYTVDFPSDTRIEVSKSGTQPLFVTAHQNEWNSKPEVESSKGFKVQTYFKQNTDTIANLQATKTTSMLVHLTLDGDADYVQLEVPIPAGCSYASTYTYFRKEAHREYFKEKVVIFCDRLSKGEHYFEIPLIPRYTGRYTINPTKVELMYFPTFYGNNGLKETLIKE